MLLLVIEVIVVGWVVGVGLLEGGWVTTVLGIPVGIGDDGKLGDHVIQIELLIGNLNSMILILGIWFLSCFVHEVAGVDLVVLEVVA